ncbi:MAG: hypothetical protein WDO13_00725 [Verrucomicrobiota bacterium]
MVTFEEGGEEIPDHFAPNRLYIGELKGAEQFQQIQDRAPSARILVFAPDDGLPPGVYLDRNGSGALAHVTAPLLDNLADDPRAQLALTKVLTLLSIPHQLLQPMNAHRFTFLALLLALAFGVIAARAQTTNAGPAPAQTNTRSGSNKRPARFRQTLHQLILAPLPSTPPPQPLPTAVLRFESSGRRARQAGR